MQNMTEMSARIKKSLLDQVHGIADAIVKAADEGTSAYDVEKYLWLKMLSLGHNAMGLFFKSCGDGNKGEVVTLPDGEQVKRLEERRIKMYLTVFGEFEISRVVYGSREGQKIQHVPLDARLQFPESKFSYLLQDWDQSIAMEMPFGQVNSTISRILRFNQSVNSLERTDRKMSESAGEFWKEMPTPPADEEGAIMVTTADGKGVVMRHSELEQKKKEGDHPGDKKMSLVGSVYTVDPYMRSAEHILSALFKDTVKVGDIDHRPAPCHKHVNAALLRNEQGKTDPQSANIFSWMANEVRQRDPENHKPLVMIMDGQHSLWNTGQEYFPQGEFEVVEILDLIHVSSYIWAAARLLFDKKKDKAEQYAKKQMERILNNGINDVIKSLKNKGKYDKLNGKSVSELEKICGYLSNHAHRMAYKDYLAQGYPIASGVIEGACRNVVKDRMEHSGMRWAMQGAHAMLSLRSVHLSGLWDEFIQFRIGRETKRLYPHEAANDDSMSLAVAA